MTLLLKDSYYARALLLPFSTAKSTLADTTQDKCSSGTVRYVTWAIVDIPARPTALSLSSRRAS